MNLVRRVVLQRALAWTVQQLAQFFVVIFYAISDALSLTIIHFFMYIVIIPPDFGFSFSADTMRTCGCHLSHDLSWTLSRDHMKKATHELKLHSLYLLFFFLRQNGKDETIVYQFSGINHWHRAARGMTFGLVHASVCVCWRCDCASVCVLPKVQSHCSLCSMRFKWNSSWTQFDKQTANCPCSCFKCWCVLSVCVGV